MQKLTDEQKFWARVAIGKPDECWLWNAGRNWFGYGQVHWNGKNCRSHRIAYMLTYGPIGEGIKIRHTCDNPPCCNPSHLIPGTQLDNMRDMVKRGRLVHSPNQIGEGHGRAIVTEEIVKAIRHLKSLGYKRKHIIELLSLTYIDKTTVSCIMLHKTWKHIP